MNRVTERINHVLLEYINQTYPEQNGRFLQLIMKLPELAAIRFIDDDNLILKAISVLKSNHGYGKRRKVGLSMRTR